MPLDTLLDGLAFGEGPRWHEGRLWLSDMHAHATGHKATDHLRIMGLVEAALDLAEDILAPGGAFLCKVLQGGADKDLVARLNRSFAKVRHVKPKASRADSAEMYVLATGFRLVVPGTGLGAGTAIDEIELYGTVVPEPGTGIGILAGLGMLILRRRRNRQAC